MQHTHPSITRQPIRQLKEGQHALTLDDDIAVEDPVEIRLRCGRRGNYSEQGISVTMRTPGNDIELALGFLFTEGIIADAAAVVQTELLGQDGEVMVTGQTGQEGSMAPDSSARAVRITLREDIVPDMARLQRHFYTSSSCGVCGKSSIDSLRMTRPPGKPASWTFDAGLIYSLPPKLRQQQHIFQATGGLHAAALFDRSGNCISIREDIGRHNALDKLIGHALLQDLTPLTDHILLLSGRACYELVQKAAMAGITVMAAVSAPSSLAIRLAEEYGITLIGFLRDNRCNVYCRPERLIVSPLNSSFHV